MGIWDNIGQFIATIEAEELSLKQNGLNVGGAAAGGFQVDPAELQSLITQWTDLRDTLRTAVKQVSPHSDSSTPPATDSASLTATNATQASMSAYLTHLQAMENYADEYVTSLTKVMQNYQISESANRGSATNVHTSLA
jgi:hypothetical protein